MVALLFLVSHSFTALGSMHYWPPETKHPKEGQQALSGQTCIAQISVAATTGLLLNIW